MRRRFGYKALIVRQPYQVDTNKFDLICSPRTLCFFLYMRAQEARGCAMEMGAKVLSEFMCCARWRVDASGVYTTG